MCSIRPLGILRVLTLRTPPNFLKMPPDRTCIGGQILKNFQTLDNAYGILGIELMAGAQALDFRDHKFGIGVEIAHKTIRESVDFLDIDRPLYTDHDRMKEIVKSCQILEKVELTLGDLYK